MLKSDTYAVTRYASDEHGTTANRPRLVVTYTTGGAPINRVPPLLAPVPSANPTTYAGIDLNLTLAAVDDDGGTPDYRVLKEPENGFLLGTFPYMTYRPHAGFTGTDTFSYAAYDALSISYPQPITVTVIATPGAQTTTLQQGVAPSGNVSVGTTKASYTNGTTSTANQITFEENLIKVVNPTRNSYLEFPNLIGTGNGAVPAGSKILSARLELKINAIWATPITDQRVIPLHRLIDPTNRGFS
jgi:hypothetical protein